ncbi:hypothetical protein K488DRAFT_78965 [Vararia minispora EC-137]|uniref:Uncharacterized protein n=1 Tax=Vararia minispora EC-137 TaxID=1314806 RepID=A0ACB8QIU3_9AGAM|nr:hypothetical protein K488DRAFT_78965 [Vararia minispora EC-137]
MASIFSNVGNAASNGAASLGNGVKDTASALGRGATDGGSAAGRGAANFGQGAVDAGRSAGHGVVSAGRSTGQGVGGVGQGIADGGGAAFGAAGRGVADAGRAGKETIGTGFASGFQLAGSLSKDALDLQRNVAGGVGALGGTAIDGVIGVRPRFALFDPVANALKSVEGLEGLGESVDSINGLSTAALRGVGDATKNAIKLAGRPPTFFDPDADGIANLADTQRGFTLLGLKEKHAKIAAYALHSTFTYSTADAWLTVPNTSTLPVKIDNIARTRWGRNWGSYERVDWVNDTDIETFFGLRERQSWMEYWADILLVRRFVPTRE